MKARGASDFSIVDEGIIFSLDEVPMAGRNISLSQTLAEFVETQVASGRHKDADEVVREALNRYRDDLADEAEFLEDVRAAAAEGLAAIERGDYVTVASPEDAETLRKRINAEADQRLRGRPSGTVAKPPSARR